MRLISARELKLKTAEVWSRLEEEGELVVTSHGKPVAMLTSIPDGDIESTLDAYRRARARAAVSRIRKRAQETGLDVLSDKEIDAVIETTRAGKRKR